MKDGAHTHGHGGYLLLPVIVLIIAVAGITSGTAKAVAADVTEIIDTVLIVAGALAAVGITALVFVIRGRPQREARFQAALEASRQQRLAAADAESLRAVQSLDALPQPQTVVYNFFGAGMGGMSHEQAAAVLRGEALGVVQGRVEE